MIKKPIRDKIKNISRSTLWATSIKTVITVSHTARAIMAICSFLIRIPAEETLSFINICSCFFNLAVSAIIITEANNGIKK
jgi:hypothetical protein